MSLNTATIYVVLPDQTHVVCGPKTDAIDAKSYGKLTIANAAALRVMGFNPDHAEQLSEAELSDFIDFHIIDRVGAATRLRYEAGAARWAARASTANDNALTNEAA